MQVIEHEDRGRFLARASEWLLRSPAENNLALGVARGSHSTVSDAFFATIEDGANIVAAAVWTPPHRVIMTRATDLATVALVDHLAAHSRSPSGVLGPTETAQAFASLWEKRTGLSGRTAFEERLYALREVVWPRPLPGGVRRAAETDFALAADWWFRFAIDAGLEPLTRGEAERAAAERIEGGGLYLWDDRGPRSMACLARPSKEAIAVSYVYTPDDQRGRGYGKSCVAAVSQIGLDRGHDECVLYADLANSISNRIYTSIGYVPVTDIRLIDFL
jgi:predicted GNAT family acetyltransferase